jgi:hypothetical protein
LSFIALISLKGCPEIVNGDFWCAYNELISLERCPEVVKGNFYCNDNRFLYSLEGIKYVNDWLYCDRFLKDTIIYKSFQLMKKLHR